MKKLFLINALFVIFLFGCNNKKYTSEIKIAQPWDSAQCYTMKVPINNIDDNYCIKLSITKTDKYQFQNIWLFTTIIAPSEKQRIDTINLIFDENFASSNNTYTYWLAQNIKFKEKGNFTFKIKQAFRIKSLNNITKMKLTIEKIEN